MEIWELMKQRHSVRRYKDIAVDSKQRAALDQLIEEKTGITTMVAEDPLTAVAIGTGRFIEFQHGDGKMMEEY